MAKRGSTEVSKAETRVIKAAIRWANYADDGSVESLNKLTSRQLALEKAAEKLTKVYGVRSKRKARN